MKIITTTEDSIINGVFHRKGEVVPVDNSYIGGRILKTARQTEKIKKQDLEKVKPEEKKGKKKEKKIKTKIKTKRKIKNGKLK